MSFKDFLSENLPTIVSISACAGVIGTGYLALETGREMERMKNEDKKKKKSFILKAGATIGTGVLTVAGIILADKLNKDKIAFTKKELAETTAALGAVTKVFNEYRKREEPERDKEIMNDIALKNCDQTEEISEYEYDLNGNVLQLWTDPYINALSGGQYTCYKASEADILAAAIYVVNTFCDEGYTTLGQFYKCLRDRGIDLPEFKGEHGVSFEANDERFDYYGRGGLDFNYTLSSLENGTPVNILFFDDSDEEIAMFNEKLERFAESLSSRN